MQERSSREWVGPLQPEEATGLAELLQGGAPAAQALAGQLGSLAARLIAQQTLLQRTTTMVLAAAQVQVCCLHVLALAGCLPLSLGAALPQLCPGFCIGVCSMRVIAEHGDGSSHGCTKYSSCSLHLC